MKYLCSLFIIFTRSHIIPSKYCYVSPQSAIIGYGCKPTLLRTDLALFALYILNMSLFRVTEECAIFEPLGRERFKSFMHH